MVVIFDGEVFCRQKLYRNIFHRLLPTRVHNTRVGLKQTGRIRAKGGSRLLRGKIQCKVILFKPPDCKARDEARVLQCWTKGRI